MVRDASVSPSARRSQARHGRIMTRREDPLPVADPNRKEIHASPVTRTCALFVSPAPAYSRARIGRSNSAGRYLDWMGDQSVATARQLWRLNLEGCLQLAEDRVAPLSSAVANEELEAVLRKRYPGCERFPPLPNSARGGLDRLATQPAEKKARAVATNDCAAWLNHPSIQWFPHHEKGGSSAHTQRTALPPTLPPCDPRWRWATLSQWTPAPHSRGSPFGHHRRLAGSSIWRAAASKTA
jgi:hypothetical protein